MIDKRSELSDDECQSASAPEQLSEQFASLWQSQSTVSLNIEALEAKYKWFNVKQKLFFIADWLALLPFIWVLIYKRSELSFFWLCFFIALGLWALIHTIYVSWLRRYSLFYDESTTKSYLDVLKNKLDNCRRIARITKIASWVVYPSTIIVMLLADSPNSSNLESPIDKLWFCFIFLACTAVSTVVTHRREQKFKQELSSLDDWKHTNSAQ